MLMTMVMVILTCGNDDNDVDADGDAILILQDRVLGAERMRAWRSRMTDEKAAEVRIRVGQKNNFFDLGFPLCRAVAEWF